MCDNDADYEKNIIRKYKEFETLEFIKIFYDQNNDLNTLEPQFLNANIDNLKSLCNIFTIDFNVYNTADKIIAYMKGNKTDWALKVFNTQTPVKFPDYFLKSVEWCCE